MSDQVHEAQAHEVADETVNPEATATQENEPKADVSAQETEVSGAPVSAEALESPRVDAAVEAPEAVAPEVAVPEATVPEAEASEAEASEMPTAESEQAEPQAESQVESQAEEEPADESGASDGQDDGQDGKRVVRVLSVGQQITGTVKRIAEFGAFVDIGVGRDGLIHISELSSRRVGKVTDVLQEGQEVTAWIKKLDRDRNRISLTLIDPETKTIRDLSKGDLVQGTVTRIMPYGAFVDIGIGRDALLHVREMAQGYVGKPEDVVKVGESIEARVVDLSRRRSRVDLSLKGLRPELEPEAPVAQQAAGEPEPQGEEVGPDPYDEIEVLSPMELAFKRAVEAEGGSISKGKRGKQRARNRSIQEEIIARTLESGRK